MRSAYPRIAAVAWPCKSLFAAPFIREASVARLRTSMLPRTVAAQVILVPGEPKSRCTEHPLLPAMLYRANSVSMADTVTTRVTSRTVIFGRPFLLDEADGEQPPGIYTVETEEELLESVSFPAYRRVSTVVHCRAPGGVTRFVTVDPTVLDAALARDGRDSD